MVEKDISGEIWREYDFGDRVYRIDRPKRLFIGETTHRIVDEKGVTHCVPKNLPIRWLGHPPVSF